MHLLTMFTHSDNGSSDFLPKLLSANRQDLLYCKRDQSSRGLVCVCTDVITSDRSHETKWPD